MVCLGVGVFGFILFGTLCCLDLDAYFLCQVRKVFSHYFFVWSLYPLLSLFSFWDLYDIDVLMLDVVPEVPQTTLIS